MVVLVVESRVNLSTLNCPALFTELAGRTQYFHHEPTMRLFDKKSSKVLFYIHFQMYLFSQAAAEQPRILNYTNL